MNNVHVGVDSRIELLSIVQLFTSWKLHGMIIEDSFFYPYKRAVLEWFSPYRNHKAVKICQKLVNIGFTYDAPVGFVMHLSEPPELKVVKKFSNYHIKRAGGEFILREFVKNLRKFANESDFMNFWESQNDFYKEVVTKSGVKVDEIRSILQQLKEFFRASELQYQAYVILALLIRETVGYGYMLEDSLFTFIGPWKISEGFPIFGEVDFQLRQLIRHEYAHLFVNSITERYRELVNKYAYLFDDIKERMMKMAYGTWEIALNEHIIRATTALLMVIYDKVSEEKVFSYLKNQERAGFKYIWSFYEALKEYLNSDLSFEEFYPKMLTHLERRVKSK
mgnify:CR=1 FL=1